MRLLFPLIIFIIIFLSGCNNSHDHNLTAIEKLQEKTLQDPIYANADEATKEAIRKKFNIELRSLRMPDGKIVGDVPNYVSDSEVLRKYNKSWGEKKNNQLPPEVLRQFQEEANKDALKAIKELEANKNKLIYQPMPANYLQRQLENQLLQNDLDFMESQQRFRDQELMYKLEDIEANQERIIRDLK
jgi:hypothetical protein